MAQMVRKALLLVVLLLVLGLMGNHHEASAAAGRTKVVLSQEELEDLEFERQLKMLNKPPIKTIQLDEGDIYDCIDIQKQPALDHPKLQNHQIQMRPSSYPKGFSNMAHRKDIDSERIMSTLQTVDCPHGTIPIRKTTKEDLKRAKPFFQSFLFNRSTIRPNAFGVDGTYEAFHKPSVEINYYGVQGRVNVANPAAAADQFSSGVVYMEGNHPTGWPLQILVAGWAVSPILFNDTKTRFFTYSNPDDNVIGCPNLLCKGFVQVSQTIPLGVYITPISVYNGTQYEFPLFIFQENKTGNWWLRHKDQDIGYWPKELYSGMDYPIVGWGGFTRQGADGKCPPMGNGRFPGFDYKQACYVTNLKVVDVSRKLVDPPAESFTDYSDNLSMYKVVHEDREPVLSFFFGGPGGVCPEARGCYQGGIM